MNRRTRRQTRLHGQGNLVRMLFAAFLLAMVVLPITGRGVGAEDLKQIDPVVLQDMPVVDPGTVVDPPIDTPTPTATAVDPQQLPDLPVDTGILDDPVLDPGNDVNDLYVNPILCPYDVDLGALDYYGLAAACNLGWANGYELYVLDSASNPWIHQVIHDGPASQSGLPTGDYAISLTHPASGYSPMRIICSADDMLGNDVVPAYDLAVFQYGGTVSISGGLMYWCDAFVVQDAPVHRIDVAINKHGCPQGIVSADPYFLASICQDMLTGIDFTLTDGNGNVTLQTTAGAPAMANFSQVVGGNVTIQETIPGGFQEPFVMCSVNDTLGNDLEGSYRTPAVSGGAFTLDNLPADTGFVFCDVFNFPTDTDGGSIIVVKRYCPVDYDILSGDPAADCGQPQDGVQFNTTGPNGYSAQTNTGDSISSAVFFGGLEAGEYQVAETLPADVAQAWTWSCTSDYADLSGFAPVETTSSPFTYDLADNEDIVCFWYNVPTDDGSVTIHKWECPVDVEYGKDVNFYLTECTEPLANVEFGQGKLGDSATAVTTDAGGNVSFSVDANSDWVIEEHVPSGYNDPIVFCRWGGYATDNQGNPFAVDGFSNLDGQSGAAIQVTTKDSFGMDCNWFNVPTNYDQSLTIYKYWCSGYVVSADNCQLGSGVKFVVASTSGGSPILTQTGGDGYVTLTGLTPGSYTVTEKDYEWCKAVSSNVDADGNVVITEGQETVLTVYNCTPDTGKKEPPVKKFPNTGAGSLHAGGDDELILLGGMIVLAQVLMVVALRGKGVTLQTLTARIGR